MNQAITQIGHLSSLSKGPNEEVALGKLARDIRKRWDDLEQEHGKLKAGIDKAVLDALELGKWLNDASELVRDGSFKEWVNRNCPSVQMPKAQRYMRVSKSLAKGVCDTRQAYLALDIIPEAQHQQAQEQGKVDKLWFPNLSKLEEEAKIISEEQKEEFVAWCTNAIKRLEVLRDNAFKQEGAENC
jgi:hypothetical protein